MRNRQPVALGNVAETRRVPRGCRAVEAGPRRPPLRDPRAQEIVAQFDDDRERRLGGSRGLAFAGAVRVYLSEETAPRGPHRFALRPAGGDVG